MNIHENLKYSEEHEWVFVEGNVATIGITEYAQGELGDVVFVELPSEGDTFYADDEFGTIEAVKAVSSLFSPVDGEVIEVNTELEDSPELVNKDPYGKGWMIKLKIEDESQLSDLLDSVSYDQLIAGS